jgi:cob(I)alamin adenosyltransferase
MSNTNQSIGKTKIYTKVGDKGTSSLYNGDKHSKDNCIFEALGDLDELSAEIGLIDLKTSLKNFNITEIYNMLHEIQSRLLDIGSHLATPISHSNNVKIERTKFDPDHLQKLEEWTDKFNENLPTLKNFLLPQGQINKDRVVSRRAERRVVTVIKQYPNDYNLICISYLNRLSSFFFTLDRYLSTEEIIYKKA